MVRLLAVQSTSVSLENLDGFMHSFKLFIANKLMLMLKRICLLGAYLNRSKKRAQLKADPNAFGSNCKKAYTAASVCCFQPVKKDPGSNLLSNVQQLLVSKH